MAASLAAKAGGDTGDGPAAAEGAAGAAGKAERVRSEAEILDGHMDFKVKKSGAMDRAALGLLLVDLGFAKTGDPSMSRDLG